MRTTDFSKAPEIARGEAVFIGGTAYTSPLALLRHAGKYREMVRQMKRMPGYRGHHTYYQPPLTLGTVAFFDTQDDLMRFARTGAHRDLMIWLTESPRNASAGWIRTYTAHESGYTNGTWRAEDGSLGHIERFTPIGDEVEGPTVVRQRRGRGGR